MGNPTATLHIRHEWPVSSSPLSSALAGSRVGAKPQYEPRSHMGARPQYQHRPTQRRSSWRRRHPGSWQHCRGCLSQHRGDCSSVNQGSRREAAARCERGADLLSTSGLGRLSSASLLEGRRRFSPGCVLWHAASVQWVLEVAPF